MKRISVYVPQQAVIEAITPAYRLFKSANDFLLAMGKKPLFEVEYVGLQKNIRANDGEYLVKTNRLLEEVKRTDLVILPALYGDMGEAVKANERAIPWIRAMHRKGAEVASLCVGAFLLGATGLVDRKKCSTHWAYADAFRKQYPEVEVVASSVITQEGRVYSSGGANLLWNLLLYLLEKLADRRIAVLAAKYFAIDIDQDSQGAFTIFSGQKDHHDREVLRAQELIEKSCADRITIGRLADQVNVSRRSLERRFKNVTNHTVIEYLQRVRIEAAKRDFETSHKNVAEVMYEVGYADTKAFRDIFKRITGLTPLEYRNKYGRRYDYLN